MGKRKPKLSQILIAVAFAFSCFGLLLFLWSSFGGPVPFTPEGYRVKVPFTEGTQLAVESDVRISNVSVGKVKAIDLDTEGSNAGTATATIEIAPEYAPIPSDTRAILRQKTLLGETYLELSPGDRSGSTLAEGATLPRAQVAESVQLDEIFRTFDERTRLAFQVWMQGAAEATDGRAFDISTSLGALEPFTYDANRLTQTLARQQSAVSGIIRSSGDVFSALSERQGQLRGLIENADTVFTTTGNRDQDLEDLFVALPTFLRESRLTLRKLDSFQRTAQPVVRRMLPASKQLGGALRQLALLSPQAEGFFKGLSRVEQYSGAGIPLLTQMIDPTTGASQGGFQPVLEQSTPFAGQVSPLLEGLSQGKREFAAALANPAVATNLLVGSYGGGGIKALRAVPAMNPESLAAFSTSPSDPAAGRLQSNRPNPYLLLGGALTGPYGLSSSAFETSQCSGGPNGLITNPVGPDQFDSGLFGRIVKLAYGAQDPSDAAQRSTANLPAPACTQQPQVGSIGGVSESTYYQHVWALP